MVKVIEESCIGCGSCPAIAGEIFDTNDEGIAFVMEGAKIEDFEEEINEAIDSCPTGAIVRED